MKTVTTSVKLVFVTSYQLSGAYLGNMMPACLLCDISWWSRNWGRGVIAVEQEQEPEQEQEQKLKGREGVMVEEEEQQT